MLKRLQFALVGNPNTGKTTLFNALTGAHQYVGNWPGVTVEKKTGVLSQSDHAEITDLPGIYALSPYTDEEKISRNFILNDKPDVIINIVDATRLERNLYLTTQLLETGIPVLLVLNMIDLIDSALMQIDLKALGRMLGCEVVAISASQGTGIEKVRERALAIAGQSFSHQQPCFYTNAVEKALQKIESDLSLTAASHRFTAVKVFERDETVLAQLSSDKALQAQCEYEIIACEKASGIDSESLIASQRYDYIAKLISNIVKYTTTPKRSLTDRIDAVVTNRFLGLPIFALVMYVVYYLAISTIGTDGTDFVNETIFGEWVPDMVSGLLSDWEVSPVLSALIVDGMIAGVGAVLGFLPQMLVLFCCLAILEDCGYMSRIAFVLDRVFRRFGLSGKSFIPILITTGCGVPGIMASRTIESESDKRLTIMTATFMPCSAKLPVIALIAGAFFSEQTWVAPAMYFVGLAGIIVTGVMLKKFSFFAGQPAPFVMEMPDYHLPTIRGILRTVIDRGLSFVKRAGSLILLSTVVIWFLQSFDYTFRMVDTDASLLADLGNLVAPVFEPLGFGEWRMAVASFTGLLAKENLVGTLGVLFGFEDVAEDGLEFWPLLAGSLTPAGAFSLMVFNMLCVPCMAAVGAMRREMMSAKWTWFAIIYQCLFAYVISLMIYQFGNWFMTGVYSVWTFVALGCLILMLYLLFIRRAPGLQPKVTIKGATSCQQ